MNLLLSQREPRLKVIKLHGDLFYRQMAWTAAEMDDYLESIWPQLTDAVAGRDFLTVGYSLRDERIKSLVLGAGGQVWFTNYSEFPDHLTPQERQDLNEVVGKECAFEAFFVALANALGVTPTTATAPATQPVVPQASSPRTPKPPAPRRPRVPKTAKPGATTAPLEVAATPAKGEPGHIIRAASTADELIASLVGIWNPAYRTIGLTGFVLAEPRVIVTDGCVTDPARGGAPVSEIVTSQGLHLPVKPMARVPGDPFGPLLLEVPHELQAPGLRLSGRPLSAGQAVQIGFAVRHERPPKPLRRVASRETPVAPAPPFGLSRGHAKSGQETPLNFGWVQCGAAVELACAVAPGCSGAPVVDEAMAVRGFIVGGHPDLKKPQSFMFPATKWAAGLSQAVNGTSSTEDE
jgi:hypothetical protein